MHRNNPWLSNVWKWEFYSLRDNRRTNARCMDRAEPPRLKSRSKRFKTCLIESGEYLKEQNGAASPQFLYFQYALARAN